MTQPEDPHDLDEPRRLGPEWPEDVPGLPDGEQADFVQKMMVWMERKGLIPPAPPDQVAPDVVPDEWTDEQGGADGER